MSRAFTYTVLRYTVFILALVVAIILGWRIGDRIRAASAWRKRQQHNGSLRHRDDDR